MTRLGTFLPVLLSSFCILSGCGGDEVPPDDARTSSAADTATVIPWQIDGSLNFTRNGERLKTIDIEIADTDSSRMRGMMQREAIPDDWGMLFIFPNEEERGFWMANTPMALDLMFIAADSTIINIARYVQPMSAKTIPSEGPAQYVLEVAAGYSDAVGIVEGDRVNWSTGTSGE